MKLKKKIKKILLNILKKSAENGNINSLHFYAMMLLRGDCVEIDKNQPFKYLKWAITKM